MIRQGIKRIHRIIGITLAALWLVQALTGALIVFHWEAEDALIPGPERAVDVDALGHRIEALPAEAGPGWALSSVWVSAGDPTRFEIAIENPESGEWQSYRVAGDGTVLRRRSAGQELNGGGWVGKLVSFHHDLLAGERGSWIIGISGILLFTNILLGLKLAWPKARTWSRSLWPRGAKGSGPRIYSWHRALGLWIAPPALLFVACGTLLVFEDGVASAVGAAATPPQPVASDGSFTLGPEAAIRIALGHVPKSSLVALYPPTESTPWYDIRLLQPNEIRRAYGKTNVLIDARSGVVLRLHDPASAAAPRAFVDALFPIHTGEVGGLAGRLLVMLTGISLATMVVLGLRLWWVRRR